MHQGGSDARVGAGSSDSDGRPSPRVYLHVGAPKTGTTSIQNMFWRNREATRGDGLLYPGVEYEAHFRAALDLLQHRFEGHDNPKVPGAWQAVVDEVHAWGGDAFVSHELLGTAFEDHVDRALDDLDFAEVHIVLTVRDLARQIPAAWQENVKNRHSLGFSEFLDAIRHPEDSLHPDGPDFWRMQDAVDVLRRWSRHVPPERVHVVTAPPPDAPAGVLWRRIAGLVGLDPDRYESPLSGSNSSLGRAETEMLRRFNETPRARRARWPVYEGAVKFHLTEQVLSGRESPGRIHLPAAERPWVVARSGELVTDLAEAGYQVVGDLAELVPASAGPGEEQHIDDVDVEEQLGAALDSMGGLLHRVGALRREKDSLRQERDSLRRRVQELEEEQAQRRERPVRTLVRDLSKRRRTVLAARVRWWHTVERLRRLRGKVRRRG